MFPFLPIVLLPFLLFIADCSAQTVNIECPPGEVPRQCNLCDGTCANPHPICSDLCTVTPQCHCQSGYVKNASGTCIPESECPANGTASPCGPNEQPVICGCEGTCANPHPPCPLFCPARIPLRPRCLCKPGFVRDAQGDCVPQADCPATPRPVVCNLFCPQGERCVIVGGKPRCVPIGPVVCNLLCIRGDRCVVIGGRPRCVPIQSVSDSKSSSASSEEE